MSLVLRLLPVALVAAPLGAQQVPYVRPKKQVDTTSIGIGLQPAVSSSELQVSIVYFDGGGAGTQNVYAVIGLGDGVTWFPPVRIDDDATGANKLTQFDSSFTSYNDVYALWKDERHGASNDDLYFAKGSLAGFAPNQQIDVGPATGTGGRVNDWRMAVSLDPAGDHIYVVAAVDTPAQPLDELYLAASHDGGATFAPGVRVPRTTLPHDVESIAVAADGATVHVLWADDRDDVAPGTTGADDDVWYQRSDDGGATWLPADVRLDVSGAGGDAAATGTTGFAIRAGGGVVAAAWLEELTDPVDEEVRVAVSTDGGATWAPDDEVGGYDVALGHDVDTMALWVAGNGNVCVAYNDDRTAPDALDRLYVSTSADGGQTWNEVEVSGARGGNDPRFAGSGASVGLCFTEDEGPNQAAVGADSSDFGLTWRGPVELQDLATDADSAVAGWSALYRNWIHVWLANDVSTNNVFVGGYRPQTLAPSVSALGSGAYAFDFDLVDFPASDPFGFVVLTGAPGLLPLGAFGDERVLGVTADPLFALALKTPAFLVPLTGGDGSTPTFTTSAVFPGLAFHATALSLDLAGGISIGEIADLVPIAVP